MTDKAKIMAVVEEMRHGVYWPMRVQEWADQLTALCAEEAWVQEPVGELCQSCGSSLSDKRLAAERAKGSILVSCCPERKMMPVFAAPPSSQPLIDAARREAMEAVRQARESAFPCDPVGAIRDLLGQPLNEAKGG